MGFDGFREQFPVTSRFIYVNHAAVAPVSRRVADAMSRLAQDVCLSGSFHYDQWLETYEGVRVAAARLMNASRDEIAIVKNTSEGIAIVANGFNWKTGDKVVAFREEFPANYFPWSRLEERGVNVEWLSIEDPLEAVERAAAGARLLAVSHVNYLSGLRIDLHAFGELCKRQGCLFFVDAIQGLGAFQIDVRACRIDALAADGHKWLLGPEGCGVLFVRKDLQDSIDPVEFGWTNVAGYADYASRDSTLRPDAARYECGTLNTIGCYGLRSAIEFLLEVGIDAIEQRIRELTDHLATGVERKGYEILGRRTPETASGILSFRKPGADARAIVRDLKTKNIIAAPRQGWIRTSPHFYLLPEEMDRIVAALP
jgi:selenocysteine lyase/cysteine desulfurase